MVACYHKDITFKDPAFGVLKGKRAGNMWRMLCESQRGKDFRVECTKITFENEIGHARWEAFYTFGQTGRSVHNSIRATFKFQDGKITEHTDHFNLYRWARQAIGFKGLLIGWTGFFKKKLNAQTNALLDKFESRQR